jgi:hypothetical protein
LKSDKLAPASYDVVNLLNCLANSQPFARWDIAMLRLQMRSDLIGYKRKSASLANDESAKGQMNE